MSLTSAQQVIFKADVLANPALSQLAHTTDNAYVIVDAYKVIATPDYWVYKTSLSRHDILTQVSTEGTFFQWSGTNYISRSQGERDAFREMFNSTGTVNPASTSIQAGFNDIFSGAGGLANRTHIQNLSRRKANLLEKLFASGLGTTVAPSIMSVEGFLTPQEVMLAMGW